MTNRYKREYKYSADHIASVLEGTCQSLEHALECHGIEDAGDDIEFLRDIDALVFCCEVCSWWAEICESAEEHGSGWICFECYQED
ncbi:hypothetical protein AU106_gp204 [Sinorhizobium phage phiM9]|uniref:Uncharacterized protein n=1 Tax=Sinorhizobium phage phiM9 TaxID=1636182 RepID=A0A0F6R620_9CAUD|nr:hypothetical protein AU106_gp204 [Sinorhizobium phage phiM9]AKE44835.1 hypothetical protein Sm_phiM9_208 [Sinorhizobium phage phiM9]